MENKNLMSKEEYEKRKKEKAIEEATREIMSSKLGATDNLWSPQEELPIYTFASGKKPRKMVLKKKGTQYKDNWVSKMMPIQGSMQFYINRDENGKPIGEPKKYLQIITSKGMWTDDFIDGDKLEPYYVDIIRKKGKGYDPSELVAAKKRYGIKDNVEVKVEDLLVSKFTGLDDITKAMNQYGANGYADVNLQNLDLSADGDNMIDLSNADGLDESIANAFGASPRSIRGTKGAGAVGRPMPTSKAAASSSAPKLVSPPDAAKRIFARANNNTVRLVKNNKGGWEKGKPFMRGDLLPVLKITKIFDKNNKPFNAIIFSNTQASLLSSTWDKLIVWAKQWNQTGMAVNNFLKGKTPRYIKDGKRWVRSGFYTLGKGQNKIVVDSEIQKTDKVDRVWLIFKDGTASPSGYWLKQTKFASSFDGDNYSNLINESLLDGLTENTSLLNADGDEYSNLTNQSLLDGLTENTSFLEFEAGDSDFDGDFMFEGDDSNAEGDEKKKGGFGAWLKKTFTRKKKRKDKSALETIADPQTDMVSAKTMVEAHKESGSDKPLGQWIKSEGGKNFLSALAAVATAVVLGKTEKGEVSSKDSGSSDSRSESGSESGSGSGSGSGSDTKSGKDEKEFKILGMSPVTFGIVAGAVVITSIFVVPKLLKKNQ